VNHELYFVADESAAPPTHEAVAEFARETLGGDLVDVQEGQYRFDEGAGAVDLVIGSDTTALTMHMSFPSPLRAPAMEKGLGVADEIARRFGLTIMSPDDFERTWSPEELRDLVEGWRESDASKARDGDDDRDESEILEAWLLDAAELRYWKGVERYGELLLGAAGSDPDTLYRTQTFLGCARFHAGDVERAAESLREAIAIGEASGGAVAREWYITSRGQAPGRGNAAFLLAAITTAAGAVLPPAAVATESRQLIEQALRWDPVHDEAWLILARWTLRGEWPASEALVEGIEAVYARADASDNAVRAYAAAESLVSLYERLQIAAERKNELKQWMASLISSQQPTSNALESFWEAGDEPAS
jgi:hypothetical protein